MMSKSFLNKLQDSEQFQRNNYGSHVKGLPDREKDEETKKLTGYQSGKAGMVVPSNESVERILRMANGNRHSGY